MMIIQSNRSIDKMRFQTELYKFVLRKYQKSFPFFIISYKYSFLSLQCNYIPISPCSTPHPRFSALVDSNNTYHLKKAAISTKSKNLLRKRKPFSVLRIQKQQKQQKQYHLDQHKKDSNGPPSAATDIDTTCIQIYQQTLLKATVTIQSNVRAMIQKKRLEHMKRSATKIQSIYRMRSKINEATIVNFLMLHQRFYDCYQNPQHHHNMHTSPSKRARQRNETSNNPMEESIIALLSRNPSLARIKDSHGNLPLHTLLSNASHGLYLNPNIIQILITCYPEAVQQKNNIGDLPLHLSIRNCYSYDVVHILLESYPEGASILDSRGQHPLRIALMEQYEPGENKSRGDDDRIILSLLDHIDSKEANEVLDSVVQTQNKSTGSGHSQSYPSTPRKRKKTYNGRLSNLSYATLLTGVGDLYERIGNIDSALECYRDVLSLQ